MDQFLVKISKSKKNTKTIAEENVSLSEENLHSIGKRSKMDIVPNTKDINQIQNAVSSDVVTSKSDQTTNTLLESDNLIRNTGEKSTNALILFSSGFGPYQPNNIIFPQHSGRKFRPEWYSSFPWIEYSPSSNSAFCFYCRVFPSNTSDPTFVSVDSGERFEENNLYVLNCMQDILLNDMPNNNSFKEINKMYGFDEDNLKAETTILNRMYKTVHDQNNVQSKINFIASENYKAGFPTLTSLIQLFIIIPTNSASCEKSFSCLRRLKTYLRTTMRQSRLNSLGTLQIERERSSLIDKDEVTDKFSAAAECRGRRLLLQ